MPTPLFSCEAVGRHFSDNVALRSLSLEIQAGERIALIGPSGGGKTTLLKLLAGSLRHTDGRLLVDGTPLQRFTSRELRRHRTRCGIVQQGSLLVPQLSVHRNVLAGLLPQWPWYRSLLSAVWPLEQRRVAALLDEIGLADRQWSRTDALSGGEQQRVALARALVGEPQVILADEPSASLDRATARRIIDLLFEQCSQRKATLVFSTHRVSVVLPEVERVIGLREGRLLFDAPAVDLSEDYLEQLYEGSRERR